MKESLFATNEKKKKNTNTRALFLGGYKTNFRECHCIKKKHNKQYQVSSASQLLWSDLGISSTESKIRTSL